MKRTLSILLTLVLLLLVASSCEQNPPNKLDPQSTESVDSSTEESPVSSDASTSSKASREIPSSLPPLTAEMQQKANEAEIHLKGSNKPFEVFEGIEYGMTVEEILSALSITEEQIQRGDEYDAMDAADSKTSPTSQSMDQTFFLLPSAEVDGTPTYRMVFYMVSEYGLFMKEGFGDKDTQRLAKVLIFYQKPEESAFDRVLFQLSTHYQKSDENISVSIYPAKVNRIQHEYPYWYGDTLQDVLNGDTETCLREALDRNKSMDMQTPLWTEDEDWALRKGNTYLQEVYATDTNDWFCNRMDSPDAPFVIVTYDGTYAFFTKLAQAFSAS